MRISEFERDGYINIADMETMREHDSQRIKDAYSFCNRYKVKIWLKEVNERPDGLMNDVPRMGRRYFHFIVARNGKQYRGYFTGNARGDIPSCYDLLACFEKNDPGEMGDFVQEYGYKITDKKSFVYVERVWKACWREYRGMRRLFGDGGGDGDGDNDTMWNELCEIA